VVPGDYKAWIDQINQWKKEFPLAYNKSEKVIKPQYVVEQIYDLVKDKAIIATEVGQHQMWVAHYYHFNARRTLLTSGGLGTMGYGFPAAIGAQVACPDKIVFDIAGDGSFQMVSQELATAVQYGLPVKIAIRHMVTTLSWPIITFPTSCFALARTVFNISVFAFSSILFLFRQNSAYLVISPGNIIMLCKPRVFF